MSREDVIWMPSLTTVSGGGLASGICVAAKALKPDIKSTSSFAKKKPVDFDGELKAEDVKYDNLT